VDTRIPKITQPPQGGDTVNLEYDYDRDYDGIILDTNHDPSSERVIIDG